MKKLLLASVATLAVAAFAAGAQAAESNNGLKLGLGGYFSVQGATVSQDDALGQPGYQKRKTDVFQYGEIDALAEKTFDNGLTAGYKAVFQLPQASTANGTNATVSTTIRQDFGYFSGNWGRIEAGQNYSPVYYMSMGAPVVNDEYDSADPDFNLTNISKATVLTSGLTVVTISGGYASAGNYAEIGNTPFYKTGGLLGDKVVYYTPRFNGFQAGVSYQPDANRTGDGTKSAMGGFINDQQAGVQAKRLEIAGGYDGSFSGVGVKVSGGYSAAKQDAVASANNTLGKDQKGWIAGTQLSYMNWTLGGSYLHDDNGQKFSGTNASLGIAAGLRSLVSNADGVAKTWTAGLGYATGPYHAGVSYYQTDVDVVRLASGTAGTNTTAIYNKDTDTLKRWVVGGGYGVAPGVDLNSTLQFDKYENTYGGATGNNKATIFTVGSTVNF